MGQFIAGAYAATYNEKALGQTAQGFTISHEFFKTLITGDRGGQTPQDAIYQGRAQFAEYELIEAAAEGVRELVEPYGETPGNGLELGCIGGLDVGFPGSAGFAKALVLTALGDCSSATFAGPATMTFPLSILAENYPVRALLGPDLRRIPIRQRIYGDPNEGSFGSTT